MKHTRKLTRIGTHSYAIVIPKEIVEKFGWKERQKITIIEKPRKRLELRDWKRK